MTAEPGSVLGSAPEGDSFDPTAQVLLAEGARLAAGLGARLRAVTWSPRPDATMESVADALASRAAGMQAVAVLLADTDTGRDLAPLVAFRLGSGAVLGCSDAMVRDRQIGPGISERPGLVFVKPVYGGWLEEEIEPTAGTTPVATLDLTGIEGPQPAPGGLPLPEVLEVSEAGTMAWSAVHRLGLIPPDPGSVDLVHARRVVTAGSGGATEELLAGVRELAALLGGSVGATRPVVDDGVLPKERLIGQTGRTVSPELYVALGVSGSPHHVAGVRSAGKVLAVNRDVRAPIFQFADVGYVADLNVVLPGLVRKIKEWRDARGGADEPR